ncbi:hypothetical protein TrLO_g8256 [Triparma laevis f. longispina]|uniref:Uncharacterized protein n=1 Tax=Triparma laevis f. longispina TaxID=1714387 RepID=A0A9W7CFW7_9STRA|nr:hypothetical protein TrLO_g8256 [Triparma laevis f. longispina]
MASSQQNEGLTASLQYHVSKVASHHADQAASSRIEYSLPPSALSALSTLVYSYSTTLLPTEMVRVAKHRSGNRSRVVVNEQDVRFMVRKVPEESRERSTEEERESGDLWSWEEVRTRALQASKNKKNKRPAKRPAVAPSTSSGKARKTGAGKKFSSDFSSSDSESESDGGRKESDNDDEKNDTTKAATKAAKVNEVISLLDDDGSNSSSEDYYL